MTRLLSIGLAFSEKSQATHLPALPTQTLICPATNQKADPVDEVKIELQHFPRTHTISHLCENIWGVAVNCLLAIFFGNSSLDLT